MPKIITRILLASAAFTSAFTAHAQEWTSGAEVVPVWSSGTWTSPYPADSALPADAYEPPVATTDNVIYDRADWFNAGTGYSSQADNALGTGNPSEAKFRIQCAPSFTTRADPILNPGAYPAGHGHTVFGWMDKAGFPDGDYAAASANPKSTCDGGPLNRSIYWEPSMYRDIGGVTFVVKPRRTINYYVLSPSTGQIAHRLRRNTGLIGGANPIDFNDTARRKEYSDAGLTYPGSPVTPAGWGQYLCQPGGTGTEPYATVNPTHAGQSAGGTPSTITARYLKGPNGEDPWEGRCTAGTLYFSVDMPECWDATNLRSPNGRGHWRYASNGRCPTNYVKTLHFEGKTNFQHNGWTLDLQHWYLASDRMRVASTECPDATAPCDGVSGGNVPATINGVYYSRNSHDPCRRVSVDFCNGATGHFDIIFSFDDALFTSLQINCVGMVIGGVDGVHRDCGTGGSGSSTLGWAKTSGTSPDTTWSPPTISSIPPDQNASPSTQGQRYFPVDPADQVQSGTLFDLHSGHGQ